MKKENNTTDFTKIQTPNFDQLNDIFENNLKIYNNFINKNIYILKIVKNVFFIISFRSKKNDKI